MKAGWKTTEFWKTLVTALSGIAIAFGVISPEGAEALNIAIGQIVGGIMAIVPVVIYTIQRTKAKQ